MDAADLLSELEETNPAPRPGREGNAVAKMNYSHVDMVDYIIANPKVSQGDLAARYGYSQAWICQVMQSDAWQSLAAKRRQEIVDPTLLATVNERFQAMTVRSLERLMEKLDEPACPANVVLKAVELGARAMGVGGNAPPSAPPQDHLARLAERLIELQAGVRQGVTYENAVEVPQAG